MSTNIIKKNTENISVDEIYCFIDKYLPKHYVKRVNEKTNFAFSNSLIKGVRRKANTHNLILSALVEVAKEEKEILEKIANNIEVVYDEYK